MEEDVIGSAVSAYRSFVAELYRKYIYKRNSSLPQNPRPRVPPSAVLNMYAMETNTNFIEGVFTSPFSLYKRGVGKSVYCLKTLYAVYVSTDEALAHIVFMPQEFLAHFKRAVDKKIRINMLVWDDAGFWIGSGRWQSKFVKAVREFINVIRTHIGTLMINAPRMREIARGIRDNIDIVGFVRVHSNYFDLEKRRSIIYMYDVDYLDMSMPKGKRVLPEPMFSWLFRQYLEWYPLYEEKRRTYVEIGVRRTEEALKEIAEEASIELAEIASSCEPDPRDLGAERVVGPGELEEVEEEEIEEIIDEYKG